MMVNMIDAFDPDHETPGHQELLVSRGGSRLAGRAFDCR